MIGNLLRFVAVSVFLFASYGSGIAQNQYNYDGTTNNQINNYGAPAPVQYIVCIGEHARSCPSGTVHLSCGSTVADWAKTKCKKFDETALSDIGGNRCGYYTVQVNCWK